MSQLPTNQKLTPSNTDNTHPLLISFNISQNSSESSQKSDFDTHTEKIQEHQEQIETSSSSGNCSKKYKLEKKIPIFKSELWKKKKNSNLSICYRCLVDDCELLFETKEKAKEHFEKNHNNLYRCKYENCKYMFIKDINYQKHIKIYHQALVKKYKCPYPGCDKSFTALYNQKIHYRIHTGEKPYICKKCGKGFYERANYKYHTTTAHLNLNKEDINCIHKGFCHEFKTLKTKIMHHNRLEKECLGEKNNLISLINIFNKGINELINDNNIKNNMELNKFINEINIQKNIVKEKAIDKDLINSIFDKGNNI